MPPAPDDAQRRFPKLSDTFRRYLTGTLRVRLQSPGVERYEPARGSPARLGLVAVAVIVLGVLAWLVLAR